MNTQSHHHHARNSHACHLNDLVVAEGSEPLLQHAGLTSLGALFHTQEAESMPKPGLLPWRERLRLHVHHNGEHRVVYLKRYTSPPKGARRDLRRAANARSLAGLEWHWLNELTRAGIACPTPIAWGEKIVGRREVRSALLMGAVPGRSLESLAPEIANWPRADVRRLMTLSARFVARLHGLGFVHRDLYLCHLFFERAAVDENTLHVIDLQRIRQPQYLLRRWVIKDLAALNFSTPACTLSRTNRVRWLAEYAAALEHWPRAERILGAKPDSNDQHPMRQNAGIDSRAPLDRRVRRLIYHIAGKTRMIAAHDDRRNRRWQSVGAKS